MKKIILASSSPRRIEMMKKNGFQPIIIPADIDESLPPHILPTDAVMYLALKKAMAVEDFICKNQKHNIGSVIIAADTIVYKDEIMGKPSNREDAYKMLTKIKNTDHYVATGVAILIAGQYYKNVFYDKTQVFCKDYTDNQLNAYLDTDEPYDKAGAYAIQGIFSQYIDHYVGDFDTVVGFPWKRIKGVLDTL